MRSLLIVVALVALPTSVRAAAPPRETDDTHDIVLLHPKRPYRVRLHLRVEGQPYPRGWNRQVARLFAFLDADGDGVLSPAEARHAPSHDQWRQLSSGQPVVDPDAPPPFADLSRGHAGASLADFQAYYGAATAGPLRTVWAWASSANDPVADVLFQKLDTNRDGKLSQPELAAARNLLKTLDLDDDEVLTKSEVMGSFYGDTPLLVSAGPAHGIAMGGLPFFSVRPGEPTGELAQTLVRRYDLDGNRKLSREEFALPDAAFRRLDADADVHLDAAELHAWTRLPADLELDVPLEGADHAARLIGTPTAGLSYSPTRDGEGIHVGDWFVEFIRPRPVGLDGRRRPTLAATVFASLDGNSDGFLAKEEVHTPPFTYVAWLRLADRDGDGRLSEREFIDFTDLKESIQARVTTLRMDRLHRSLFRYLDQNADGRLGARELYQAWDRLQRWQNPKGRIDRDSLPQHYRLTLSHGSQGVLVATGTVAMTVLGVPERGPVWFRKMDRNRDGDVSLKEWLGSTEQFREIDTNGDGLITLAEAEEFDRRRRVRKR